MLPSRIVCVSFMLGYAVAGRANEAHFDSGAYDQRGYDKSRTRRSVVSYTGYKAIVTLLKGAVRDLSVPQYSREKKYFKKGNMLQALADFSSVSPRNVRRYRLSNMVYGQVGLAGDRTIIVGQEKSGTPIIKFFKTAEADDPKSTRTLITYQPPFGPSDGGNRDNFINYEWKSYYPDD